MSISEKAKTQKWYYVCNMRSAYFLLIGDYIERERERESMSFSETVKTQKQYYLHHMRSGYFPINRRLHRESKRERERAKERERLCPSVKW